MTKKTLPEGAKVPDYSEMSRDDLIDTLRGHDDHHNEHHDREEVLLAAMRKAAQLFRDYETQHLQKTPPDFKKATRNKEAAEALEKLLPENQTSMVDDEEPFEEGP